MSSITIAQFLKSNSRDESHSSSNPINDLSIAQQHQMEELLSRVNDVLRLSKVEGLVCTSGFRSMADHLRIYSKKIIENKQYNLENPKTPRHEHTGIPMKSKHLSAQAIDIGGANIKELQKFCLENEEILAGLQLWCEDFSVTINWVHFQSVPYGSWRQGSSRFFNP